MTIRRWQMIVLVIIGCGIVTSLLALIWVQTRYLSRIDYSINQIQPAPYAIVLGASVTRGGQPSAALEDRLLTGIELYKDQKVSKLLLTGDDGAYHDKEIPVMKRVVEQAGVPDGAIVTDPHGYRTYESCKRAAQVYGVKDAVIVTQRFHLGRSLYLCQFFGINTQGLVADRQHYQMIVWFEIREAFASVKAWIDTHVWTPASPV